jgi:hypothetical protein
MKVAPKLAVDKAGYSLIKFTGVKEGKGKKTKKEYTMLEFKALTTANKFDINVNVVGKAVDEGDIGEALEAMGFVLDEQSFDDAPADFAFSEDAGEGEDEDETSADAAYLKQVLDFMVAKNGSRWLAKIDKDDNGYYNIDYSTMKAFVPKPAN